MTHTTQTPSDLIGQQYTPEIAASVEWSTSYPLVTVHADGTVGTIDAVVHADDPSSEWELIDVRNGRAVCGTGFECDAAALRNELIDAGLSRQERSK